jgi:flavin-dependent dehydrogenase
MPKIIVLGGGVCGLAAAMLLARDGHDVTVLERDGEPPPATLDDAVERWDRDGVTQFRQPHYLLSRGREVLDEHLPDLRDAMLAAGGVRFDVLAIMPGTIADRAPRPGDERFVTVTARRPAIEWVFARAAEEEPGLELRRGIWAKALTTAARNGVPHVTGVRTAAGETLHADLVVDAMGRRSQLPALLRATGAAAPHEEAEESGFIYYTRYFRGDGALPQYRAAPLSELESFTVLTLPGDNGTWSVTLFVAVGDRALKALRRPDRFAAALRACPAHAHWLDGEPLTGVLAMGGVVDRYRRLVVDGRPVATGVVAVADAWACTNPSRGRGIALGLLHARYLRDFVRYHLEDPRELAEVWDTVTEVEMTPWYRATVDEDRDRLRALDAARSGHAPPRPRDREAALRAALPGAAMRDADVFRAMLETRCCLATPAEVLARPGMAERVLALAPPERPSPPGPDRAGLLALLA